MNIKIAEKEIVLKPLNLNSIEAWEKTSGKSFTNLKNEGMSVTDLKTLVWLGIKQIDKEITAEQVGEYVNLTNLKAIQEFLVGGTQSADPIISES